MNPSNARQSCAVLRAKGKGKTLCRSLLSLRELEASAGASLAVLLALLRARITSHKTFRLESLAKLGVELHQGAGDAELDGVRLAHHAATTHGGDDVECFANVIDAER